MINQVNPIKFGKMLKNTRQLLNLTQMDVSNKIQISSETLRRIENGYNIPSLKTIEDLSIVYKVDILKIYMKYRRHNDYAEFYDNIDSLMLNYDHNHLISITEKFNELSVNKIIETDFNVFMQYKIILEGLELSYNNLKGSEASITKYIEALKITISDFSISSFKDYKYSYIEIKCLFLISIELNVLKKYKKSNTLSLFILKNISLSKYYIDNTTFLIIKLIMNISYNYHGLDNFEKSLFYSNKGIEFCIKNRTSYLLHGLYYRRGISKYLLKYSINDFISDLKKSIYSLEINEMHDLKKIYIETTKSQYNIDLEI